MTYYLLLTFNERTRLERVALIKPANSFVRRELAWGNISSPSEPHPGLSRYTGALPMLGNVADCHPPHAPIAIQTESGKDFKNRIDEKPK